jgi:WD40 repeat protein
MTSYLSATVPTGSFWLCHSLIRRSKSSIKIRSNSSYHSTVTRWGNLLLTFDPVRFKLFFISQLPVLSMDISSDSKLIVTCSADKNVKIWGLDFGDCHKSIFAHDESVMQVAFENDSHYFWTVGKDKMLKYWDGDKVRHE